MRGRLKNRELDELDIWITDTDKNIAMFKELIDCMNEGVRKKWSVEMMRTMDVSGMLERIERNMEEKRKRKRK